jgi:imidazolonepropionase-like amidohydrolase
VALRTATSNAAKAMGAGDQVGPIRTGMLADIVFVNGDPLYKISDLFNAIFAATGERLRTLALF